MQNGFTLLELLVSCLLFSVGMLGSIGSQLYARQVVMQATERLQATAVLTDIFTAIQTSPRAVESFNGQYEQLGSEPQNCLQIRTCNPQAIASYQLHQQLRLLFTHNLLPAAKLCIANSGVQPRLHVSWHSQMAKASVAAETLCEVGPERHYLEFTLVQDSANAAAH